MLYHRYLGSSLKIATSGLEEFILYKQFLGNLGVVPKNGKSGLHKSFLKLRNYTCIYKSFHRNLWSSSKSASRLIKGWKNWCSILSVSGNMEPTLWSPTIFSEALQIFPICSSSMGSENETHKRGKYTYTYRRGKSFGAAIRPGRYKSKTLHHSSTDWTLPEIPTFCGHFLHISASQHRQRTRFKVNKNGR